MNVELCCSSGGAGSLWEGSLEMSVGSIIVGIFEIRLFILFCKFCRVLKYFVVLVLILIPY